MNLLALKSANTDPTPLGFALNKIRNHAEAFGVFHEGGSHQLAFAQA